MARHGQPGRTVPPQPKRSTVARGRQMNKSEAQYAALLEGLKASGQIAGYGFEAITLKLAEGCRYTPDFAVWRASGALEFHEVKAARRRKSGRVGAHMEDDARVKILTAAKLFPFATFFVVWLNQGKWVIEEIRK